MAAKKSLTLSAQALYFERMTRRGDVPADRGAPWTLPLFASLHSLKLETPVTFLVGENGCGKSTLLEAMAVGMEATAAGTQQSVADDTLVTARRLAAAFRFGRKSFADRRLLFRAEDILGFTRNVVQNIDEIREIEADLSQRLAQGYGRDLALATLAGQRRSLELAYGRSPLAKSHGETFLGILRQRLKPKGLYFLDEPEAPLSPARVLELMALLGDCVAASCQFVIATHSPMLMAMPGARILFFNGATLEPVLWTDCEPVVLMRSFLNRPDLFLAPLTQPQAASRIKP